MLDETDAGDGMDRDGETSDEEAVEGEEEDEGEKEDEGEGEATT